MLVELIDEGRASLADATVVLLDEYVGLPPADPARCDARLRRELLDLVSPPPRAFHPIRVDDLAPAVAAREHDAVAAQGLDLALLGLGMNGHIGLNEPGSTADSPTRVVPLAESSRAAARSRYGAGTDPAAGITLGMDRLLAAHDVWVLVTGAHKADVLARALLEPASAECPASYLRRHPRLRVIADEPAAELVQRGGRYERLAQGLA